MFQIIHKDIINNSPLPGQFITNFTAVEVEAGTDGAPMQSKIAEKLPFLTIFTEISTTYFSVTS